MQKLVANGHFCRGWPTNLEGEKNGLTDFTTIIHSPNPTFVPSLSDFDDMSCTSPSLFLPMFLMNMISINFKLVHLSSSFVKRKGIAIDLNQEFILNCQNGRDLIWSDLPWVDLKLQFTLSSLCSLLITKENNSRVIHYQSHAK